MTYRLTVNVLQRSRMWAVQHAIGNTADYGPVVVTSTAVYVHSTGNKLADLPPNIQKWIIEGGQPPATFSMRIPHDGGIPYTPVR